MYSWGASKYGQAGHGDRQLVKTPKMIDTVCALPVGTSAVSGLPSAAPTSLTSSASFGGSASAAKDALLAGAKPSSTCNFVSIASGEKHCMAVTADGQVRA